MGVYDPICSFEDFVVDAAQEPSGLTHGFARLGEGSCGLDARIRYFEGSGNTWTQEITPYHGLVMGVASDTGVGCSHNWASPIDTQGDVVATGGRWWAVWTEFAGTTRPQLDLFQAYTIGGTAHGRQRIATHQLWDWGPKLALTPRSVFPLILVWVRGNTESESATQTDLRRLDGHGQPGLCRLPGGRRLGRRLRLTGQPARLQFQVGLVPSGGKATALNVSFTSRLYATTET